MYRLVRATENAIWLAGSHTVLSLLEHGCKVTIIDNLDNAFEVAYERMQKLAGEHSKNMKFIKVLAQSWQQLAQILWS